MHIRFDSSILSFKPHAERRISLRLFEYSKWLSRIEFYSLCIYYKKCNIHILRKNLNHIILDIIIENRIVFIHSVIRRRLSSIYFRTRQSRLIRFYSSSIFTRSSTALGWSSFSILVSHQSVAIKQLKAFQWMSFIIQYNFCKTLKKYLSNSCLNK